jgi:hypothetical protein
MRIGAGAGDVSPRVPSGVIDPMKCTLIYDGPLSPGDGKRAMYASKIRNQLHPQMLDLWQNHVLMRQLSHEARVYDRFMGDIAMKVSQPRSLRLPNIRSI